MVRNLCSLLGQPTGDRPQSWWQLWIRALRLESPLQRTKGNSRRQTRGEARDSRREGRIEIMPEKAFDFSWIFLEHVGAVGGQQARRVGGEVLVGVLVGMLVLVVVLVELEGQGTG